MTEGFASTAPVTIQLDLTDMLFMTLRTPLTVFAIFSARDLRSSFETRPLSTAVPPLTFTSIDCDRRSWSSRSLEVMSSSISVLVGAVVLGAACEGAGTGTGTADGWDGGTTMTGCCGDG